MKPLVLPAAWHFGWARIDDGHQVVVDLLNEMAEKCRNGSAGRDEADTLCAGVETRLCEHFEDEEVLMDGLGYPGLDWHRSHHRESLERIRAVRRHCHDKGRIDEDDILLCFDEVLGDIAKADLRFQAFLQGRGRFPPDGVSDSTR